MSGFSFTNSEAINITLKSIQEDIAKLYAVPEHFIGSENTDTLGMVKMKMSLQAVPVMPHQLIPMFFEPSPAEKLESDLRAWQWVNKYRRRNLACKISDKP